MAESVIDILIRARTATSGAIKKISQGLNNVQEAMAGVNRQGLDGLDSDINEASSDSAKLKANLDDVKKAVNQLNNEDLDGLIGELDDVGKASKKTRRSLKELGAEVKSAGTQLREAGQDLAVFGAALVAGPALAVREFARVENAIAQVNAIITQTNDQGGLDIGFTPQQLKEVTNSIEFFGRTTAFTAEEVAQGFRFLAQAGLSVQEQLDAIGPSLNLAAAGNIDLAAAADIATNAQTALGLSAKELPRVVDALAVAASKSNTDVLQLGQALKVVAAAGASLNIDVEELTGTLGAYAQGGIQGANAGTQLRRVIVALAAPTSKAKTALKELGVEVRDSGGNFRGIQAVLSDLNEANITLPQAVRIFGQYSAVTALGTIRLSDFAKQLTKTTRGAVDFAEGVAAARLEGTIGQVRKLSSAFSGLLNAIGSGITPALEKFAKGLTDLLNKATEYVNANPQFVAAIAGTVGVLGTAAIVIGGATAALGFMTIGFGAALTTIATFTGFLSTTGLAALASLAGAFTGVRNALIAFNALVLATTFKSLIAGVVASTLALKGMVFTAATSGAIAFAVGIRAATASVVAFSAALLANPIGVALVALAASYTAITVVIRTFEDELISAGRALGFFNENASIPAVARSKEQIKEFEEGVTKVRVAAEKLKAALGDNISEDFAKQLSLIEADLYNGKVAADDAAAAYNNLAAEVKKVAQSIATEEKNLETLKNAARAQEIEKDLQATQVRIDAQKLSVTARKKEILRLTQAIDKAAKEREAIETKSAEKATQISQQGALRQLDLEARLRENRRAGSSESSKQSDIRAEASSRLTRARRALLAAQVQGTAEEKASAIELARADINRASQLAGQIQSQSQQRTILKELSRVEKTATETALQANEALKKSAIQKSQAEQAANEKARTAEEERLKAAKATLVELEQLKESIAGPTEIDIQVQVQEATERLRLLKARLDALQSKDITVTVNTKQGAQAGGTITPRLQSGGYVGGNGGAPTRLPFAKGGRVPVILEDGEFRMPPERAGKFMGLLSLINSGSDAQARALSESFGATPSRLMHATSSSTGGKLAGYGGGDRRAFDVKPGTFIVRKERTKAFLPMLRAMMSPGATVKSLMGSGGHSSFSTLGAARARMGGFITSDGVLRQAMRTGGVTLPSSIDNPSAVALGSTAQQSRITDRVALDFTFSGDRKATLLGERDEVDNLVASLSDLTKTLAGGIA